MSWPNFASVETSAFRSARPAAEQLLRMAVLIVLFAAFACSDHATPDAAGEHRAPNIILLLADDLGWGDVGVYNPNSVIPTPNMDRLAQQGIRFTDAHSPSSVCTPTRYAIMTGRYAWRTRLKSKVLKYFEAPLIERGRLTLPELLRGRHYVTAAIGKWHLGLNIPTQDGSGFARLAGAHLPPNPDFTAPIQGGPLDYGFDTWFGAQLRRVRAFVRDRHFIGDPQLSPNGLDFRVADWDESQKGAIQLAEALDFIDHSHASDPQRPFFLYFASQAPHLPSVPPAFIDGIPVAGTSGAGPRGDLVVELDVVLGKLLERLETLGINRETLILFTSDNGPTAKSGRFGHDASGLWRGEKGDNFEGGHRMPFIARWGDGTGPGSVIPPGSISHQLIGLQDLIATLSDLIDAPLPADAAEDAESFLPALLGRPTDESMRSTMVHHSAAGQFAIRRGDWKLILEESPNTVSSPTLPEGVAQLYNLSNDPREQHDRRSDYPEIVKALRALLARERRLAP